MLKNYEQSHKSSLDAEEIAGKPPNYGRTDKTRTSAPQLVDGTGCRTCYVFAANDNERRKR